MAGPSDNGGWPPDGGPPDDLPDLPEEWGVIVIPDDLSELSDEVAAIRAELRLAERPGPWRRMMQRPVGRRVRRIAATILRAPVLIVSMAVMVTVASLFASTWPVAPRQPAVHGSASNTVGSAGNTVDEGDTLPALELLGTDGHPVQLGGRLPAVILVTDGCTCDQLVLDTTNAVRPDVAVVVIVATGGSAASGTGTPPAAGPQAQGKSIQVLHAAAGSVRPNLKFDPPDGTAAALLVDRTGAIVRRYPHAGAFEDLRLGVASI